ncbi:MAG TPA: DUF2062 domain-containing protein [Tepidisphaeraceae bacterium]|jgi:uncharacterized protein (DUF2062 family)|nr:DUF2062 domain-containing protein [Tepidisphaeraceae bacterium]
MSIVDLQPVRLAVVAPTYNNARWLGDVLSQLDATGLDVIAVDDGCTDGSEQIIVDWQQRSATDPPQRRHVVRHASNRGKAQAMQSGFAEARRLGFTHALTIDTDGQHCATDVLPLAALARQHPEAMVIGARSIDVEGYPRGSRVGRAISNFLVYVESGARVSDSQCGLRVYPLGPLAKVRTFAGRFGYETEVITRFAWAGGAICESPIHCVYRVAGGRTSHFRPWRDSVSASLMHMRLLGRAAMPWPVRKTIAPSEVTGTIVERIAGWLNPMRTWRQVRQSDAAREKLALSVAAGAGLAALPIYGLKTVIGLALARVLSAPPLALLASSSLFNTPPIGALVAAASIGTGHVLLQGRLPTLASYDLSAAGFWQTFKQVGIEWAIGGCVVGAAMAITSYVAVRLLVKRIPSRESGRPIETDNAQVAPAALSMSSQA